MNSFNLLGIISNLCINWNISDTDNYALQFAEINNKSYITEKNRIEIKNGSVLKLRHSPTKTTFDILETLKIGTDPDKVKVLQNLVTFSSDITFALEFIKEQGLKLIEELIENPECKDELLKYAQLSFVELMEHNTVSWDIFQQSFISRNIHFMTNSQRYPKEVVQAALSNLENIVQNSLKYGLVEKEVAYETLLELLMTDAQVIQQNTIALLNALFMRGDIQKRRIIGSTFADKRYRQVLLTNVMNYDIGSELAHQMYVFQTLTFSLLHERMTPISTPQDQDDAIERIRELRKIAFGEGGDNDSRRQNSNLSFYKKLGFKCDINPTQDFLECPPGMLSLDCMLYFARNYKQNYTKVVLENSCRADEHECPFGRTSIELVKLLSEILHIGEQPSEQGQDFQPLFFTHDHSFEEFFCICIVVLNKTWKDMRATIEDFAKVFSVVREQIKRSLSSRPNNLEDFKSKISALTYQKITALRMQERDTKDECESTAYAIVKLKEKISPEIESLIKAERLGFLVDGTRFPKYVRGHRSKDKFWYVRLSPNQKVIHYGDCDEKSIPNLEELSNKVLVVDIKQLLVGKECPHTKEMRGRKSGINLSFSITFESMDHSTLDFMAPDEKTFHYWTDGLNALLGQPMTSKQHVEDFETLLSMEIKLRLLDTEGVDISCEPPPIPDDPENYDFCYDN